MADAHLPTSTLERRLGLLSVIGISMGAMLGSGLFVLPGIAATHTGHSIWLAYVVAGLCVLPAALSKAELATAMPISGGAYVYVDQTLGPLASTITGLGLWLSLLLKSAFALVGFGAYLRVLTNLPIVAVGLALLGAIVVLNVMGVRNVGRFQAWVVLFAVAGLLLVCALGARTLDVTRLEDAFAGGSWGFLYTVSVVYISYAGVTKIAAVAEEVQNPSRNLPLGMLLSLGLVTLLYGVVTFTLVGNVPLSALQHDVRPIYTLAEHVGGSWLGVGAAVLGVVTMTSMANAGLLAASRFPFAMSRGDLLPRFLSYVDPRFMTPVAATGVTGALMGAAIIFLDVEGIAKLASALMIAGFMAQYLVVIVLRETHASWYKPTFRSPFYPLVQLVGLVIGFGLLVMLGFRGAAVLVATGLAGSLVFVFIGRTRTERRGVVGRLGPRHKLLSTPAAELESSLPNRAAVVVPLMHADDVSDRLIGIGMALAHGAKLEVVHCTEVPEQLLLDSDIRDSAEVDALRARIEAMANGGARDVEFDTLLTRDAVRTVHSISRRLHCDWIVMEWRGRGKNGLLPFTPLGWLVDHLACNLALFKDAGERPIHRILVLAEPGPHDALVARTAQDIADVYGAHLTFVRYVKPGAPAMARQAEVDYLEQLCKLCAAAPASRLVEGADPVRSIAEITKEYDLLVMGAPPDIRFRDHLGGTRAERLTRLAACSVLRLKTPREQTHAAVTRHRRGSGRDALPVARFIAGACSEARMEAKNKEALFSALAHKLAEALPETSARDIEKALWEREETQNTAVGQGLALPHATVLAAKRTYLAVFTLGHPIDYKAPDGAPVDVLFVTIGPPSDRTTHLQILASLAHRVLKTPLLTQLRAARSTDELLTAFAAEDAPDGSATPVAAAGVGSQAIGPDRRL